MPAPAGAGTPAEGPDAPEATGPMISLHDVHKVYELRNGTTVRALDGLTLDVPAGAIHGVVGTSGAGKSTLVRCLTALEQPTSGTVKVAGQDMTSLRPGELREARRAIGMVFQHANLLDSRTTAQNVAYPLALAGVPRGSRHETVARMLELVGLGDRGDSYPAQLSGGQKQRVGIARALADQPAVLLCDEPTSALDPDTTRSILELIRDVRDRLGVTVVIITHEMSVVRQICDSVSLLDSGRVVESGPIEQVVSDVGSRLSHELVPLPDVPPGSLAPGHVVLDVALTAHPGQPAAARVMALAAEQGADVAGGVFETLGTAQVGRLALSIPYSRAGDAVAVLREAGVTVEERA
ncbi:MAG: methionine ABC transporter ATP-binding protein [Actinomyces sp.]|uniref:methionine ABC transporter ATP-binding protein n=1 Tax=Actinomyces sp. TaxID=29317 RepID=UPI0026DCF5C0|nr:methionine ABC transporter ATP-binding protein [Actinomyces sp.]MDO4243613.1 methionine ABC transporter ATP-binding protein [Actinomyces sp.]